MPRIWKFVGALMMSGIAMAETHFRVAIDGEPLVAADLYLYTGPDQRAWIATVADGATDIPEDVVAATLLDTKGSWQWVIVTPDDLVYASSSQATLPHDWRAALAGMGNAAQADAFVNLPAPIELEVTVVRSDGHPAAHAYGSIGRVFDHVGPCGQAQALSPMRLGMSASPDGRIGWRLAPGRYSLLVGDEHHAIELMDDDDPQRTRSLRIELSEQRPFRLRAQTADGRAAAGVMLARYVGECLLRNFGSTDADGRVSTTVRATDVADLVLGGWNDDGQPLRIPLGDIAIAAWKSGDELTATWQGRTIDAADLPTPTVSVDAALPNLLAIRFEPSVCKAGGERGRCRFEFCRADAAGTCWPLLGPDAEGRHWAHVDAGTQVQWKARATPTDDLKRWRASPWTAPVPLQMPALPDQPPEAPDQCRVHAISPYALSIHWGDRSDNEYGFELTTCLADSAAGCRRMILTDRNTERFELHGLPADTALTLQLRAFNPAGASAPCTMTASTPRDADLDAARKVWDERYGRISDDPQADVADVESLSMDWESGYFGRFDARCTSRRELLSSVYPRFILQGQRQIEDLAVDVYEIDDTDSGCPRSGCGLHAFGSAADQPACYRWLGQVLRAAPPTATPPRPAITIDLRDASERLRWFRSDSGVEVDRLELCSNDGERAASEIAPPYQINRYGRMQTCQLRPWRWPEESTP
ncbi:MAG: hypothetical protein KA763_04680 [Xanthomonadales bacterium]|nr:hypothetical protein [Xanthomonadales bacterium]